MSNRIGVFFYLASFVGVMVAALQLHAVGMLGPWFLVLVMTVGVLFSRLLARLWPMPRFAEPPGETIRHVPFVVICTGANTLLARPLMFVIAWWLAEFLPATSAAVINSLPLWLLFPACLLVYEFMGYLQHRIVHRIDFFWRTFHCVHHEPTRYGTSLALRLHFLEYFLLQLTRLLLLNTLQVDPATILLVISISVWGGVLPHTDTGLVFGWINHLIATPETHVWHHAADHRVNYSFGMLNVFDKLGGTFCYKPGEMPAKIGIPGWRSRGLLDALLCRACPPFRAADGPGR
jgi:sterol desaturase/sphingolipid hydroxylase (fatty acid hydroxylase superfamily)